MTSYSLAVGQAVKRLREARSMSQEELARRAGIHRTYVGGVERGERNPTVVTLKKLADGLGVEPSAILQEAEA